MTDERICRWCKSPLSQEAESLCQDCTSKEEMLKEGLTTCPELLDQDAFDRFLWKLAVYALKVMEHPEGGSCWTLEHIRNSLTHPIIRALPMNYVSFVESGKREPDGPLPNITYTLKSPIPKALLFKILERLKIWDPVQKDGEPDGFMGA